MSQVKGHYAKENNVTADWAENSFNKFLPFL
jgi:hypothetical protein